MCCLKTVVFVILDSRWKRYFIGLLNNIVHIQSSIVSANIVDTKINVRGTYSSDELLDNHKHINMGFYQIRLFFNCKI